jgi:hypothetical protein
MNRTAAVAVLATAASLTAGAALANFPGILPPVAVPEIDALSGTAALAAVAGAVLFVRERMKR